VKKHVLTVGIRVVIFDFYENDKKGAKNDVKKDVDSMNFWRLKISQNRHFHKKHEKHEK
jgi:hypothetical protein